MRNDITKWVYSSDFYDIHLIFIENYRFKVPSFPLTHFHNPPLETEGSLFSLVPTSFAGEIYETIYNNAHLQIHPPPSIKFIYPNKQYHPRIAISVVRCKTEKTNGGIK